MTQLAFLGSGIMGLPMSLNLLAAGYRLAVYNRTAEKAHRAVAAGATHAQTPRAAAEGAEAVIVMVTGPEAVDERAIAGCAIGGRGDSLSRCARLRLEEAG